ncbi:DJ-1/PfpI family protein [Halorussus amylolyticus]|uniref:DJ-1/PfpI family protein n=1 Tax=Halorussus amylolyticus TaxID=1126242 RepID=UPI00104F05D4|nr:DJ-1/PfpI family protein [Halorussus amylolyticus]
MTTRIAVVVYDGFDEMDAVGPYEVLSSAAGRGCDLDVSIRTLDPTDTVTAAHGLRIGVDGTLADADPDIVVVPGGGWSARTPEASAWAEAQKGDLPAALADLHERGVELAAVCTGGMLLAEAGILDGRPAVTHASAVSDLRETDAEVVDARVVDDGDVLTAGGVTSGIDLALHLVERLCGEEMAEEMATRIEYDYREDVYGSNS